MIKVLLIIVGLFGLEKPNNTMYWARLDCMVVKPLISLNIDLFIKLKVSHTPLGEHTSNNNPFYKLISGLIVHS